MQCQNPKSQRSVLYCNAVVPITRKANLSVKEIHLVLKTIATCNHSNIDDGFTGTILGVKIGRSFSDFREKWFCVKRDSFLMTI
jgi:hypothetical protein